MVDTVIASDGEERRAVLLAVLQMHHHRVLADVSEPSALGAPERLPSLPSTGPIVLLLDVELDAPGWVHAGRAFVERRADTRSILITPSRSAHVARLAREAKIGTIVHRPFSIPQLLEALEEPPRPSAPAPDVPSEKAGQPDHT